METARSPKAMNSTAPVRIIRLNMGIAFRCRPEFCS
jgi:hypothetical protein